MLHRGERAFALLNRFPYASGHLMVAPVRHVGEYAAPHRRRGARDPPARVGAGSRRSRAVYSPQGHNLGWNLGRIAGAGIVDHVHLHVVPRWAGDTNFMPVLADVRVLPEALTESARRLREAWPQRFLNEPLRFACSVCRFRRLSWSRCLSLCALESLSSLAVALIAPAAYGLARRRRRARRRPHGSTAARSSTASSAASATRSRRRRRSASAPRRRASTARTAARASTSSGSPRIRACLRSPACGTATARS